jgi:hypothetical protein
MKLTLRIVTLFVLVLSAAAIASANSVGLTLDNGGSNVMGGVYVGPYNFTTSNGQSLQLVCDDFYNEVYPGESWTATTSTVSSLGNVMFSGSATQYQEIAWLVGKMSANMGNAETVGDIQWAIWDIFDSGISAHDTYGTISGQDQTNINNWLLEAEAACGSGGCNSNLTIYTPVSDTQTAGDDLPQEYIGVPEPSSLALLVAGMLALMLLVIRRGRA